MSARGAPLDLTVQTTSPSPKECVPTAPLEYMLPLDIHLVEAEEQTSVAFWQRGHQPSQKGAQHRRGGPFFRLSIGKSMPFSSPKMLLKRGHLQISRLAAAVTISRNVYAH